MLDDAAGVMEQTIEAEELDHVFVEFPDLNGISRGKQVAAPAFLKKWRDGFSMNLTALEPGALDDWDTDSYYGFSTDFADGTLRPILETFTLLPWREDAGRVLCKFTHEGEPVRAYTRGALARVLKELTEFDFEASATGTTYSPTRGRPSDSSRRPGSRSSGGSSTMRKRLPR